MDKQEVIKRVKNFVELKLDPPLYPGATRCLSGTKDMTGLDEWRKRIGEEEATRILNESLAIGTSLDKIVEDHFSKNNFDTKNYKEEQGLPLYKQILPHLKNIECIETQLTVWSDRVKVKGIMDIFGYYKDELTIIDIKNSRKPKCEAYVEDYFLQCTTYAMATWDLLEIPVKKIALVIAVRPGPNHLPLPQVFVRDTKDYIKEATKRIRQYHATHDYFTEKNKK